MCHMNSITPEELFNTLKFKKALFEADVSAIDLKFLTVRYRTSRKSPEQPYPFSSAYDHISYPLSFESTSWTDIYGIFLRYQAITALFDSLTLRRHRV